ncbi:hypothetical protein D049_3517B, partial [Vibrio parahaemolyticus VPTS-2010]
GSVCQLRVSGCSVNVFQTLKRILPTSSPFFAASFLIRSFAQTRMAWRITIVVKRSFKSF